MILTDREIQTALEQELLVIEPRPLDEAYSSTTVDLTLDAHISEYNSVAGGMETILDPSHADYRHEEILASCTTSITIPNDGYIYRPGKLLLAWTAEYIDINVKSKIAARVEGKSSLARLGIGVHITAPIIHAGFDGQIRLEMMHHGKYPVRLKAGMRICQLVFEQTLGTPVRGYKGRFSGQTTSRVG
jgi:dCTP deaminase